VDFQRAIEAVIPGVQGRVLAVLAETTADLNLRTIARLAGVSVAQASRVLPDLVELGIVERREVPPSSQFRLARDHVVAGFVVQLAAARSTVMARLGDIAGSLPVQPVSVIVFGSMARGEADRASDIDTVLVRPADIDADDPEWERSVDTWRARVRALTGNVVEIVEIGEHEIGPRLRGRQPLWQDIKREGVTAFGRPLPELQVALSA
jgi:hypothetical protein